MDISRSDGSVVITVNMDTSKADKELGKLKKKITDTEAEIEKTQKARDEAHQQGIISAAELDAEKAKLQEMKQQLIEIRQIAKDKTYSPDTRAGAELSAADLKVKIADQQERVRILQADYNKIVNSVDSYDKKLKDANETLEQHKETAGQLVSEINAENSAMEKMKAATAQAEKQMNKFANRIKRLAKNVFVFTLISSALRSLKSWMWKAIKTNDDATASVAKLKGALLTLVQPLLNVIIPAFTKIVNILAKFVAEIAKVVSILFGTTAEASADAAENLYNEMEAIDGVGTAAKKATKMLAAFDEINQLTSETATSGSSLDTIKPDFLWFKNLSGLPAWLENLTFDLEAKIQELKFLYDNGTLVKNKDSWISALTGLLGAVLGTMFGGLRGAVLGALLGLSIGLISCTFLDKTDNPDAVKDSVIVAISSILGAALGLKFGGLAGGIIGLLLGASISLIALEFAKGDESTWDKDDTLTTVLSAILGAIIGAAFGGLVGGIIGFLLGGLISFVSIKFSEGNYNKQEAIASLRIAIFAILGLILGTMFGGLAGGVLGLVLGMTIGFSSVAFDKELEASVRNKAKEAFKVAMFAIIGALIGAAIGGVFGGIAGGVIGLTLGLAVTIGSASIKDKTGTFSGGSRTTSSGSTSTGAGRYSAQAMLDEVQAKLPALARGAVIPPNREFLAVLGDQRSGTNIETPLSTMVEAFKQAMTESGNGGTYTFVVNLDGREVARNTIRHMNDMTRERGRSVVLV